MIRTGETVTRAGVDRYAHALPDSAVSAGVAEDELRAVAAASRRNIIPAAESPDSPLVMAGPGVKRPRTGSGRPSTTLIAARRKVVDGRPSPAMTGWAADAILSAAGIIIGPSTPPENSTLARTTRWRHDGRAGRRARPIRHSLSPPWWQWRWPPPSQVFVGLRFS
jgi:hypothetical protein